MAKIVKTDSAPSEVVHYTFAAGEFDLGGRVKFYETDNPSLIESARAHDDLRVEVEAIKVAPNFHEQLAPEDDGLSGLNSHADEDVVETDDKSTFEKE